ncbi:hypothetical protein MMC10_010699 [Thelotrema lepadinum]|nr:hypothetical protein [Thelotrema lepadinum]
METASTEVTPKSWRTRTDLATQMSPYSVHQYPPQDPDEVLSTTVLADNIHCGSCVKHIEELVSILGSDVLNVSVSIVNKEAHFLHNSSISPRVLCRVLEEGAFEVSSATTVDKLDRIQFEYVPQGQGKEENTSWLWSLRPATRRRAGTTHPLSGSKSKNPRHIENCTWCQKEIQDTTAQKPRSDSLKTLRQEDGPHGLDIPNSPPNAFDNTNERSKAKSPREKAKSPNSKNTITPAYNSETPIELTERQEQAQLSPRISPQRRIASISIGGMTCASCTNTVKEGIENMGAITNASIDLMSNSAKVEYTSSENLGNKIVETIEDLGYDASLVQDATLPDQPKSNTNDKPSDKLFEATLSIGGMTCTSCSNTVNREVQELPYVKKIAVSLMNNSATVIIEGEEDLPNIVARIEDLGYECSVDSTKSLLAEDEEHSADRAKWRMVQLKVDGMFCQHCPPQIQHSLQFQFGSSLQVQRSLSLKTPIMTISYQPSLPTVSIRRIIESIHAMHGGFEATVYHPASIEDRSQQLQLQERRRIFYRLVLAAVAALPTLLIGIVWMSLVSDQDSMRMYFEQPMWSGGVTRAEWALFILATPVYFFSADEFHIRALKEIRALWRRGSKVPIFRRLYRFGSMNLLISAGTTVAYVSSIALLVINATSTPDTLHNSEDTSMTYFDSVVFLTFFILIGKLLEAMGKSKAGNAVSMLGQLRPQLAVLVCSASPTIEDSDYDGIPSRDSQQSAPKTRSISSDLLEIGDIVIVAHGASPPADGIVVSGQGNFDESSLTGESKAVQKSQGDKVFVGTVNAGGPVRIEITELGGTSMLDQIISVVREGQTKRAPIERVADVVTGYFVPIVTILAIITFFVWFALGQSGFLSPAYLGDRTGGWAFWSLEFAIAVFVVACPCGIGLAAPTALFVGGGLAAKHGILVRGGGEAFQEAGGLDAIVFDKTGTLTEGGDLQVTNYELLSEDQPEEHVWSMAAALEASSSHPIAQAILACASKKVKTSPEIVNIEEVPGRGLRGSFIFNTTPSSAPITYEAALGSEAFITSLSPSLLQNNTFATQLLSTWKSQAKSVAVLAIRRYPPQTPTTTKIASSTPPTSPKSQPPEPPWTLAALLATSDALRPSSFPTISALRSRNIPVYMLSGDNPQTASAVGTSLGIPVDHIFAGVLPAEKAEKIRHLQKTLTPRHKSRRRQSTTTKDKADAKGEGKARVAFIGDGINDAPALTAATISLSLSSGSPIALTSSSFILMSSDLTTIITLLDLSKRVFRRIKFNFGWALVYNVVLVPVAAGVLFKVRSDGFILGPVWAAAAMAGSSVSVVGSSLALRWEGKGLGGWGDGGRKWLGGWGGSERWLDLVGGGK